MEGVVGKGERSLPCWCQNQTLPRDKAQEEQALKKCLKQIKAFKYVFKYTNSNKITFFRFCLNFKVPLTRQIQEVYRGM